MMVGISASEPCQLTSKTRKSSHSELYPVMKMSSIRSLIWLVGDDAVCSTDVVTLSRRLQAISP